MSECKLLLLVLFTLIYILEKFFKSVQYSNREMSINETEFLLVSRLHDDYLIADTILMRFPSDWWIITVAEREHLLKFYRCPLCQSDPVDPYMCRDCHKCFCLECLKGAFEGNVTCCPHCR